MTALTLHHQSESRKTLVDSNPLSGLLAGLRSRLAERRTIEMLSRLDDRTLADIGLHRSDLVGAAFLRNAARIQR